MKIIEYRGFSLHIHESTPHTKAFVRTHKNTKYLQTSRSLKDAKNLVDFCLKYGIWE